MPTTRPRIISGAKVKCYINNRLMGIVTGFQFSSVTDHKEIRGIDVPHALELAPTMVGVTGSITVLRLTGDGGLQGQGVIARHNDVSRQKYFTILLVERGSDLPLFKAEYCSAKNENWNVIARGLMTGSFNFTGISWTNEAGS